MDTVQQTTDTLETTRLIAADKVEGTPVESTNGDSLGHVHDIMIDKISGQVGYAVLKYGSFLGLGGKLFALPWDLLKYDTKRNAYVIGIPVEKLKGAPSFDDSDQSRWPDLGTRSHSEEIHEYYGSHADWFRNAR
ncbi:MAG TPA: PRC-barrel domain-containing protein [Stellaceae bacterium]|jgi:sporulation protein YlmC with PRC-barrel domain|nr:PRC-barrel domain-containing protein [Stellaceae bacterium]